MLSLILLAIAGVLLYFYFNQARETEVSERGSSQLDLKYETSEEISPENTEGLEKENSPVQSSKLNLVAESPTTLYASWDLNGSKANDEKKRILKIKDLSKDMTYDIELSPEQDNEIITLDKALGHKFKAEIGSLNETGEFKTLASSSEVTLEEKQSDENGKKTLSPINLITSSKYQSMDQFKNGAPEYSRLSSSYMTPTKKEQPINSFENNETTQEEIHTQKVDYINLNALSPYNINNQPYNLLEDDTVNSTNSTKDTILDARFQAKASGNYAKEVPYKEDQLQASTTNRPVETAGSTEYLNTMMNDAADRDLTELEDETKTSDQKPYGY